MKGGLVRVYMYKYILETEVVPSLLRVGLYYQIRLCQWELESVLMRTHTHTHNAHIIMVNMHVVEAFTS